MAGVSLRRWRRVDLNYRPRAYESPALATELRRQVSNLRFSTVRQDYKLNAIVWQIWRANTLTLRLDRFGLGGAGMK
jgi:hypothetical protein